jgi:hypothetical protein
MNIVLTLQKTIPSGSHNAPYSEELGEHWPAGHLFKLCSPRLQTSMRKRGRIGKNTIALEEVGGEETTITVPVARMPELFGVDMTLWPEWLQGVRHDPMVS